MIQTEIVARYVPIQPPSLVYLCRQIQLVSYQ